MKEILKRPWVGPLIALLLVYGGFAAMTPDTFLRGIVIESMARHTVIVALCAVGMTLVIVKGGIDLSVGSTVALVTVVVAKAIRDGHGVATAALAGLVVGALCGALNGALVTVLRVTPFIVTLCTMRVLRGVAKGLSDEQKIDADARGLEDLMGVVPQGSLRLMPTGAWLAVAATAAGAAVLGYTRYGRHVVAVGSSPATAKLCGVSTSRVTIATYAVAGVLAGAAGVLEFAMLTVGDPTDSMGLELEVIAAVVIGGASLSGGQGSVPGSLVGALLMTVIATGATHMGVANWIQDILTGLIILIAVALDRFRNRA